MARLRHPERGTEIEVEDDAVDSLKADGWTAADNSEHDDEPKRRKSNRKDG